MSRMTLRSPVHVWPMRSTIATMTLVGSNLLFSIVANVSFKFSATSSSWRGFLAWQLLGNVAGFITVLTLTGLLRFVHLRVAYPITAGLAVIGVQVVAAALLFREPVSPAEWLGSLLVVIGMGLIGRE